MSPVVAIGEITKATREFVSVHFAEMKLLGGQFVGAAEGEPGHCVVNQLVATGNDRHEETVADMEILSRRIDVALAVRTMAARDAVAGRLEQWLVVARVAVADEARGEAPLDAVLDEGILRLVAAPVDVGHIPGDAVAPSFRAAQSVVAGLEELGLRLASQAGALVAINGRGSCKWGGILAKCGGAGHYLPFAGANVERTVIITAEIRLIGSITGS